MTQVITQFAEALWAIFGDMAPYLILGFVIAGILSVVISQATVEKHIGVPGAASIIKASLFGIPLPLCSCGVIPVGMSLRRHGAGRGASTAFIITTPEIGVDSLLVTYSLLGPLFAVIRVVAAFVTGIAGGLLVNAMDSRDDRRAGFPERVKPAACTGECCAPGNGGKNRVRRALTYGLVTLPKDIGAYLFWGLLAAAAISALVPQNYLSTYLGGGLMAMLVMMLVGIPMYVCSTASVPIAAAFMAAGVSPGAALVFLMTGPATNAATITTVWNVLGRRTAIIYLGVIAGGSLLSGLLLDALAFGMASNLTQTGVFELPGWFKSASAVVLLALLAPALFKRFGKKQAHGTCGCDGIPCATDYLTNDTPAPAHAASCGCGAHDAN